ncbi:MULTISPECIES: GAF and ANTAR domain-containing protein [unclassified Rhodococcus (in: high G+C Gram-positive bacteria)]|uniref:GAF and ANTAR domain-containing protein n=1 Tax=unclassified Rhodococcus (in: high G+C Gram-positive bacteria) TaxID=192944 RepID=UPI00163974D4|nr:MULTISPECIES: GAF and ANTAR domain-containing protein [unclassified Rhodococcus (in: high G+C Gram-positive bacteria)]MBC2637978.1 GAF and ANTAR domain-containing protein [Rhodococcus sp. 3A]MBC2897275.1 GAF and ANTAR domain-containing protein [Rhodococcus sp. 4CII]
MPSDSPSAVFAKLAEMVYSGDDFAQVYQAICDAAATLVPGCTHASLMLKQNDQYLTVGASDSVAAQVDALERAEQEGPCLDAIEKEAPQVEADLARSTQWPRLAQRAIAETPVRGAAGFRLLIKGRKVGALNLFSDTPGIFTDESIDQAILITAFAAVTLTALHEHQEAQTLREGLASNREIGKAIGLLMAFHDIPEDRAFDLLRKTSQDMNIKLTRVAREIIAHHNSKFD